MALDALELAHQLITQLRGPVAAIASRHCLSALGPRPSRTPRSEDLCGIDANQVRVG